MLQGQPITGAQVAKTSDKPGEEAAPLKQLRIDAVRLVDENEGNIQAAAKALEAIVWKDRNKRDALMEPLVLSACQKIVGEAARAARTASWSGTTRGSTDRVIALGRGTAAALLDFPLPETGKALRAALPEEVGAAAKYYETRATDSAAKARWLRLVEKAVPAKKTVGDALTEERLGKLQSEALHA